MLDEAWVRTAIELIGMGAIALGFVYTLKGDTRLLGERMDLVDVRLDRIDTVLEKLSEAKGRMDVLDERLLQQGKRLDETIKRVVDNERSSRRRS